MPLAILERVEEHGRGAQVQGVSPEPQQVRSEPGELAADDTDRAAAFGHLEVEQLLDREHDADVRRQRREVVHPVGVGDELQVGAVLGDLLHAAVQVAEVRHALTDALAVELQHQPQHAVGRRVRRPHVDGHDIRIFRGALDRVVHRRVHRAAQLR